MNHDNSALLNKLTLLVLSLILVCLVMLVVRAYQQPLHQDAPAPLAEAVEPTEAEAAQIESSSIVTNPPVRRLVPSNITRPVPPPRPVPPLPSVQETQVETSLLPVNHHTLVVNSAVTEIASGGGIQSVTSGPSSGSAPELSGLVTLVGQPKPEIAIELGPSCGRINSSPVTTRHFVVGPAGGLANVVIWLENSPPSPALSLDPPAANEVPLLDQIGCMYEPYMLGVMTGQPFNIRNSDPELHNVHATPQHNKKFNFGQPLKGQVNRRTFSKPEFFVRIKCDIHPWMFAYVNVLAHRYFAITDTNGVFRIPSGFSSGTYTVVARHLKSGELRQQVSIGEGERRALHFQFTPQNTAEPEARVARTH